MDGKRSSMRGEFSTDAHVRSAGSGTLDVRPQLRIGGLVGQGAGQLEILRRDVGRPFKIFSGVIIDRDGTSKDVESSQGSIVPVARSQ